MRAYTTYTLLFLLSVVSCAYNDTIFEICDGYRTLIVGPSPGMGLQNQIILISKAIILAYQSNRTMVCVRGFKKAYNSNDLVSIKDIFDLPYVNNFTTAISGLQNMKLIALQENDPAQCVCVRRGGGNAAGPQHCHWNEIGWASNVIGKNPVRDNETILEVLRDDDDIPTFQHICLPFGKPFFYEVPKELELNYNLFFTNIKFNDTLVNISDEVQICNNLTASDIITSTFKKEKLLDPEDMGGGNNISTIKYSTEYIAVHLRLENDFIDKLYSFDYHWSWVDYKIDNKIELPYLSSQDHDNLVLYEFMSFLKNELDHEYNRIHRNKLIFVCTDLEKSRHKLDIAIRLLHKWYPHRIKSAHSCVNYDLLPHQGREINAIIDYQIAADSSMVIGAQGSSYSECLVLEMKMKNYMIYNLYMDPFSISTESGERTRRRRQERPVFEWQLYEYNVTRALLTTSDTIKRCIETLHAYDPRDTNSYLPLLCN